MGKHESDSTRTARPEDPPLPPSQLDEGRFPPGSIIAQRYRIVSLLGRGGMGEVYRANDLLVGQPVALKFLPESWVHDAGLVARFRNEVRTARMVTHENVCRVYDLGEAEGRIFLSMEFIDGEDLGALLRRIGRFPEERGLELARKLCAGLQAAHGRNVLHRDLKPANVMIDGRGEPLITDFGLAGISGSIRDVRSGTPAYMAPEQRGGAEVTQRSDIYSLGVVLHELFTGKHPAASRTTDTGLEPAIRTVIERCLSPDPEDRPASALEVARSLPGGDPLAAAIAAGITPSPDLVAAAGGRTGLRRTHGIMALVLAILGPILAALGHDLTSPQPPVSPAELQVRARDLIQRLGGELQPYETSGIETNVPPHGNGAGDPLRRQHSFWYRGSPYPLGSLKLSPFTSGGRDDPPMTVEGMVEVAFDMATGRLIRYERVPRTGEAATAAPPDWGQYLRLAGVDPGAMQPVSSSVDTAVWKHTDGAGLAYEISAVSTGGRPRHFEVRGSWEMPSPGSAIPWIIETALIGLAVLFAWRNYRDGKSDPAGARFIMMLSGGLLLVTQLLRRGSLLHWSTRAAPVDSFAMPLLAAGILGTGYLAMEPYVRRYWPSFLTTWVRLTRGNWADPAVGRDVLVGMAASGITMLVWIAGRYSGYLFGPDRLPLAPLQSTPYFLAGLAGMAYIAIWRSVTACVLLFLLRLALRNEWLASAAWMACFVTLLSAELDVNPPAVVSFVVLAAIQVGLLMRFGFLAKCATEFTLLTATTARTLDMSTWYAEYSVLTIVLSGLLAVLAFRSAIRGAPVSGPASPA